jgi:hypothetical protein
MRKTNLIFGTLVVSLALTPAFAKGKPATAGGGKSSEHGKSAEHGKSGDHSKDHAKNEHGRDGDPAGYDKGKKTGWGDCDAPPGQEKKAGADCKDHKKSGGIFGAFKKNKKSDAKSPAKTDVKAKPADVKPTAKTDVKAKATTTTTSSSQKTSPTTTTSRPARTTRAGAGSGGQEPMEEAKKK